MASDRCPGEPDKWCYGHGLRPRRGFADALLSSGSKGGSGLEFGAVCVEIDELQPRSFMAAAVGGAAVREKARGVEALRHATAGLRAGFIGVERGSRAAEKLGHTLSGARLHANDGGKGASASRNRGFGRGWPRLHGDAKGRKRAWSCLCPSCVTGTGRAAGVLVAQSWRIGRETGDGGRWEMAPALLPSSVRWGHLSVVGASFGSRLVVRGRRRGCGGLVSCASWAQNVGWSSA